MGRMLTDKDLVVRLQLCGHHRIKPVACSVGYPRSKGKVERPSYYLGDHPWLGTVYAEAEEALAARQEYG